MSIQWAGVKKKKKKGNLAKLTPTILTWESWEMDRTWVKTEKWFNFICLQKKKVLFTLIRSLIIRPHLQRPQRDRRRLCVFLEQSGEKKRAWATLKKNKKKLCRDPACGRQTSSGVFCLFYKHWGDQSEVVDSCFSALIHVESESDSCIGPLHSQTWPITTVAHQQYSLKCTKCVSQKKKKKSNSSLCSNTCKWIYVCIYSPATLIQF